VLVQAGPSLLLEADCSACWRTRGEVVQRRRVKTQGSLPSEDAALILLFGLVVSGQITEERPLRGLGIAPSSSDLPQEPRTASSESPTPIPCPPAGRTICPPAGPVLLSPLVSRQALKLRRIDGWRKIATVLRQQPTVAA